MRIFRLVLAGAGALVAGPLVLQSNAWAADPAPVYGTSRDNDEAFPGYFLDEHYARLSAAVHS